MAQFFKSGKTVNHCSNGFLTFLVIFRKKKATKKQVEKPITSRHKFIFVFVKPLAWLGEICNKTFCSWQNYFPRAIKSSSFSIRNCANDVFCQQNLGRHPDCTGNFFVKSCKWAHLSTLEYFQLFLQYVLHFAVGRWNHFPRAIKSSSFSIKSEQLQKVMFPVNK